MIKDKEDIIFSKVLDNHSNDMGIQVVKEDDDDDEDVIFQAKPSGIRKKFCLIFSLIVGLLSTVAGILSMEYDFVEELLKERMTMRPGLPPMEQWREPKIKVRFGVYFFHVLNPDAYLNGTDKKLKLQEIGPIMYEQILRHENITQFEHNSTMSYDVFRELRFLEDENESGILNRSIIVPNTLLLGLAGRSSHFAKKIALNFLSRNDHVFLNRTVYQLLWNLTTPTLESLKAFAGFLVPRENAGILYNAFYPKKRHYNVNIGYENGYKKFFTFNTFNDMERIPAYEKERRKSCPIWIDKARDGANFPPNVSRDDIFYLWREDLCQLYPLVYERELNWLDLQAYKFKLSKETYARLPDSNMDCLKKCLVTDLPDGLSDGSKCALGMPVGISNPHFYDYGPGEWMNYLEGIHPVEENHSTYLIIEPRTGIPLKEIARLQTNLVLPKLQHFSENISKLGEKIIPVFWGEYIMSELTPQTILGLKFVVLYLPVLQNILIWILLITGIFFIIYSCIFLRKITKNKSKCNAYWHRHKEVIFVQEPIEREDEKETEGFVPY